MKFYLFVDLSIALVYIHRLGYQTVKGSRLKADELRGIFQGLLANELLEYDYILTGYMGSGELLQVVAEYVPLIKSKSPNVKYRKNDRDREREREMMRFDVFHFGFSL